MADQHRCQVCDDAIGEAEAVLGKPPDAKLKAILRRTCGAVIYATGYPGYPVSEFSRDKREALARAREIGGSVTAITTEPVRQPSTPTEEPLLHRLLDYQAAGYAEHQARRQAWASRDTTEPNDEQ